MTDTIQQFDFSVDLLKALLWQYNNAPNLQELINEKQAWYELNQTEFWQNWLTDVFDLRTANDFGLSVWSIILNQPLFINLNPGATPSWGFGAFHTNFSRGNFSNATNQNNQLRLDTDTARRLLQLRYFQLTSSGTVPEVNRMLKYVFGDLGLAFLNDNHDMTQFYTFMFPLSTELTFIFDNFDILPRPAGVGSRYEILAEEPWAFDETRQNFDNGNFSSD